MEPNQLTTTPTYSRNIRLLQWSTLVLSVVLLLVTIAVGLSIGAKNSTANAQTTTSYSETWTPNSEIYGTAGNPNYQVGTITSGTLCNQNSFYQINCLLTVNNWSVNGTVTGGHTASYSETWTATNGYYATTYLGNSYYTAGVPGTGTPCSSIYGSICQFVVTQWSVTGSIH